MRPLRTFAVCFFLVVFLSSLYSFLTIPGETKTPPPYLVYVTNETSGDLSVIDPIKMEVISTVPLGKRPRGIHASPEFARQFMWR